MRQILKTVGRCLLAALAVAGMALGASQPAQANDNPTPAEAHDVKAERWWRIVMYEWEHGKWRYAGSFENPDRSRCIRYGEGWKEGKPGYRTYSGPYSFQR